MTPTLVCVYVGECLCRAMCLWMWCGNRQDDRWRFTDEDLQMKTYRCGWRLGCTFHSILLRSECRPVVPASPPPFLCVFPGRMVAARWEPTSRRPRRRKRRTQVSLPPCPGRTVTYLLCFSPLFGLRVD